MLLNLCSKCSNIEHPIIQVVQSDDCISKLIDAISLIITFGTLCATAFAIYYAVKEYRLHCKQSKADILHKYNERYSRDENIKKVVEYLILKKEEKDISIDKHPSTFEKEMFLRFFEELEYAIESEALDAKLTYDMFAFYALEAAKLGENFVSDYNENSWGSFKAFINRMKKL